MIIQRFNVKTKQYEDCRLPNTWRIKLICDNDNEKLNCVNCGKEITFSKSYTSMRYHNNYGIGYLECENCYFSYMPIYIKYKEDN